MASWLFSSNLMKLSSTWDCWLMFKTSHATQQLLFTPTARYVTKRGKLWCHIHPPHFEVRQLSKGCSCFLCNLHLLKQQRNPKCKIAIVLLDWSWDRIHCIRSYKNVIYEQRKMLALPERDNTFSHHTKGEYCAVDTTILLETEEKNCRNNLCNFRYTSFFVQNGFGIRLANSYT